jgi:hypothetical protein
LNNHLGAATPTNLRVVCENHDSMRHTRLIPRGLYEH